MTKKALRGGMRARLAALPPERFLREGRAAAAALVKSPTWAGAHAILLFRSLPREIDTGPLAEAARAAGKGLFFPRVEAADSAAPPGVSRAMRFYAAFPGEGAWTPDACGITAPARGRPLAAADFPCLILTPGLCFDAEGRRLGRGGGFYDRFFARLDNAGAAYTACGLCLECQLIPPHEERIPTDTWDTAMDLVLAGGILSVGRPRHSAA
ncbi:MAG: 5-formyltetrahydrofolate cyclo-ligase [Treponema sp.]|jgi:5-formyltetrahydrofolate cyclo-ligase|nr:5-formyltetrahydrofolate cyclo-ligase [Treponema sp.]